MAALQRLCKSGCVLYSMIAKAQHTLKIDMGRPIPFNMLDDAFAAVVQRRIVGVADADAGRV
jgi:hypothetical protein